MPTSSLPAAAPTPADVLKEEQARFEAEFGSEYTLLKQDVDNNAGEYRDTHTRQAFRIWMAATKKVSQRDIFHCYRMETGEPVVELFDHPTRAVLVVDLTTVQLMWRDKNGTRSLIVPESVEPGAPSLPEPLAQRVREITDKFEWEAGVSYASCNITLSMVDWRALRTAFKL